MNLHRYFLCIRSSVSVSLFEGRNNQPFSSVLLDKCALRVLYCSRIFRMTQDAPLSQLLFQRPLSPAASSGCIGKTGHHLPTKRPARDTAPSTSGISKLTNHQEMSSRVEPRANIHRPSPQNACGGGRFSVPETTKGDDPK